jgi:DNA-binding CsgD family transcriptional regulator
MDSSLDEPPVGLVTVTGRVELSLAGPDGGPSADLALEAWTGLVDGRLALREHTLGSGERAYTLHRRQRDPARTLSRLEEAALSQVAFGATNKEVAWALGLSEAQVSRVLRASAEKVGLPSGREAGRVAALVLGAPVPAATAASLTPAEREVAALLAEGLADREIAARRGTAVRTASNQVAAILRKTGAPGRRAFLGHVDRGVLRRVTG